ncbi:hypothetical protein KY290_024787 [Solanum tuberosum]|uniref:Uncharacterized protein n=1 Tax=Solanum tuberosum TaxID=4113 RepID=A0ABQ7URN5_SOLTU|nr:hypothetical protein KY284_023647 [Solanum tuberosum]KAH0754517.1 hypothetical protein KY290_024787 [Solanum tuberosum]
MKTTLAPKARTESQKGVTTFMEANHEHSTIFVPRLLNWNDSHSVPKPSSSKTPEEAETEATEAISVDNNKGKVTRVDFSGDIPKVFYEDLPTSPTASEMDPFS